MYINCNSQGNGGAVFAIAIRDGAERGGLSAGRTMTGAFRDAVLHRHDMSRDSGLMHTDTTVHVRRR